MIDVTRKLSEVVSMGQDMVEKGMQSKLQEVVLPEGHNPEIQQVDT
jgi:hypothetical protein